MVLHTFGWAITMGIDEKGNITDVYPARVKFRGFAEKDNIAGYAKVSEYIAKNGKELETESKE